MAKPLRIGSMIDVDQPLPDMVAQLQRYADAGLDHAFAAQIFGPDALDAAGRRRRAGARDRPGHRRGAGAPAPPDDAGAAGPHRAVGDGQPAPPRHRALPPGGGREHVGA